MRRSSSPAHVPLRRPIERRPLTTASCSLRRLPLVLARDPCRWARAARAARPVGPHAAARRQDELVPVVGPVLRLPHVPGCVSRSLSSCASSTFFTLLMKPRPQAGPPSRTRRRAKARSGSSPTSRSRRPTSSCAPSSGLGEGARASSGSTTGRSTSSRPTFRARSRAKVRRALPSRRALPPRVSCASEHGMDARARSLHVWKEQEDER